nr:hypothetical protein [Tanacetum cinerariifolium]
MKTILSVNQVAELNKFSKSSSRSSSESRRKTCHNLRRISMSEEKNQDQCHTPFQEVVSRKTEKRHRMCSGFGLTVV